MRKRTIERLMNLECFAYDRWLRGVGRYDRLLSIHRLLKSHIEYRGVL